MPLRGSSFAFAALALTALIAAQSPAPPATPPAAPGGEAPAAPTIRWEQDYAAALARAAREKRPLFVAFLMDNEPGNDAMVKDHYKNPNVIKLLEQFVCLVACLGEHKPAEGQTGCGKFPGLACAHHQAIEKAARAKWLDSDLVTTPQHVFCDPSGNVLRRKIYLISKSELGKCLLLTLEECGIDTKGLPTDFGQSGDPDVVAKERESVTQWLADLDSVNLDLRTRALRNLGSAEDARAFPAVLKHLGTKHDDAIRMAAVEALGRKGNHQAVAPLVTMLGEQKTVIAIEAAEALEAIQLPTAMPALLTAIKKEKRDRLLGSLLRAAARCQPGNADVRTACLKQLSTASSQLTAQLLVALGHLDTHDKIVSAVVPLLKEKNQHTRGLAIWTLGSQRTAASLKALQTAQKDEKIPEVMKQLASSIPHCRGEEVSGYDSMYSTFLWNFGL